VLGSSVGINRVAGVAVGGVADGAVVVAAVESTAVAVAVASTVAARCKARTLHGICSPQKAQARMFRPRHANHQMETVRGHRTRQRLRRLDRSGRLPILSRLNQRATIALPARM
jgi:hypothetical protein